MMSQEVVATERVACDLCGSTDASVLYALTDTAHGQPGEFELQRCRACGLMYLSPRPTPDTIARYYPEDYAPFRPPIEDESFALMRWMRRRKLSRRRTLVERYAGRRQGRLLDVGCATGLFLHEMVQSGWAGAGVELTGPAAEFAHSRFGLDVFQGLLADAPFAEASFDAVTFWDVLEHSFSPRHELERVAQLLRPGGVLALTVPNWNSFDRGLFGRHWQGLDSPRHLYVFTRPTLTRLLEQAGFTDLQWLCFMPGYFTFLPSLQRWLNAAAPGLAGPVMRLLNFPGMRLPFEPWFSLMNSLQRGPIISVFARKTGHG
jgi:SAM-dependent methyltransferase